MFKLKDLIKDKVVWMVENPVKVMYLILGCISFIVGLAGIRIVGLPHTPFFILASWFFARSSTRLHRLIRTNWLTGEIISNWEDHRTISMKSKIKSVLMIIVSFSILVYTAEETIYRIMLVCLAFMVTGFILTRKSNKRSEK